ncbi:preprotein translocase subunit SecG [Kordiimonas pumila]|uniref:Protein-export membrane protein SecG n=1 Tax=Kordiimonas pumila TaxID=2161677 RepID=A0ABV7D1T8_9PROT|nr:preprotein translocase subunit SecG [Kordiimonas pumila]
MEAVLLTIHIMVALAMVITILLQRSEGGALGIGGGGGGGFMSARGAGNLLSKTTKWLAIIFLANSLALGWLAANRKDAFDEVLSEPIKAPVEKQDNQLPEIPSLPEGR